MSFARKFFVAIDKLYDKPQNPTRLEKELADVEVVSDIFYSSKFPTMALDIYRMPTQQKQPVIFEIHGGGFAAGDKKYRRCLSRYYAKHTGATVVNVNYGVCRENALPLPMQHLVEAINWLGQNAEQYNLDLSKVVVTGDSAGAYYACFLAILQDSPRLQELFQCKADVKFTAAVLNCGVYDFAYTLSRKKFINKEICMELTGTGIEDALHSPYFVGMVLPPLVTSDFPETLLIYAEKDVFCKDQGQLLLHVFKKQGVPCESVHSKTFINNHDYSLTWTSKLAQYTNEKVLSFLNKHFGHPVQAEIE